MDGQILNQERTTANMKYSDLRFRFKHSWIPLISRDPEKNREDMISLLSLIIHNLKKFQKKKELAVFITDGAPPTEVWNTTIQTNQWANWLTENTLNFSIRLSRRNMQVTQLDLMKNHQINSFLIWIQKITSVCIHFTLIIRKCQLEAWICSAKVIFINKHKVICSKEHKEKEVSAKPVDPWVSLLSNNLDFWKVIITI